MCCKLGSVAIGQSVGGTILYQERTYSRTPLSQTAKIQRVCLGGRGVRESGGSFGVKKI